jgi:hypothetical protein
MPNANSHRKLWLLALVGGLLGLGVLGSLWLLVADGPDGVDSTGIPSPSTTTLSSITTSGTPGSSSTTPPTARSLDTTSTTAQAGEESESEATIATIIGVEANLFVAPIARGTGSGLTTADAADIRELNDLIANARPDDVIELVSDAGPYLISQSINLTAGGTSGHPITIRGPIDGPRPELRGERADPYDPAGEPGKPLFRLASGADHLVFGNLHCTRIGNGCFYVAAPIADLVIANVSASNVRRFFENGAGEGQADATIVGLTISNVEVSGFSKGAIRLGYDTHGVRIRDVVGNSMQYDGDNFAIGVHLGDTVHDVIIERVRMDNARDTLHEYWNGDGFVAEAGVYDLQMIDTSASGNTDAGYDIKASNVQLVNATAHDNKRNFRLWGQNLVLHECIGTDPELRGGTGTQAQVHVAETATVEIAGGSFTDADPDTIVFDVDDSAHLIVRGAYVERAGAAQLSSVEATASIELLQIVENIV